MHLKEKNEGCTTCVRKCANAIFNAISIRIHIQLAIQSFKKVTVITKVTGQHSQMRIFLGYVKCDMICL